MRLALYAMATAVLALTGCSDNAAGEKGGASPPPAAPLPAGRPAIYAAQTVGPEAFVKAIYAVHVAGGPKDEPPPPGRDPMLSRMLNASIGADVRVAKGEVPTLNYDPFCACQDQAGFTLDAVTTTQQSVNAATAAVVFTNMGKQTRQTLKLIREGIAWKVDDVIDADGRSLRQTLLTVITAAGG